MKIVYKYDVHPGAFKIELPVGAQILCVQAQHGSPKLWALVDNETTNKEWRSFQSMPTGVKWPLAEGYTLNYISTFQLHGGELVFHVFEEVADV